MSSTPPEPNGWVLDEVLRIKVTLKSLRILRLCPIDEFFTQKSSGLHGSTLFYLSKNGYLNRETTKDGHGYEYYLNNHGHRLRKMNVTDFPTRQIIL
jgi:hypothetical protein